MDFEYEKLTPNTKADIECYKDALDYIFCEGNEDVRNVGITGAYGSGKSSVVKAYDNIIDKEFMYISVADFKQENVLTQEIIEKVSGEEEENGCYIKRRTNEIEAEIINVLLHKIPYEKINQTRFSLKKEYDEEGIALKTASVVYLFLYVLCKNNILNLGIAELIKCECAKSVLDVFFAVVFLGALFYWTFLGLRYLYRYNVINKISFKGNEIVLGKKETSHFDEHLDELLYLYWQSGVDVFVFEDIDRFNNVEIFERLRFINELLNEGGQNRDKKRTIRFFYLIRDDLLLNERTKFFDYIIPIVPYVCSENSYEKVKDKLDKTSVVLDDFLLRGVFSFISDYRLALNIINEYMVYEKRIVFPNKDHNKLFGLIVYKNVFPSDFASLKDNKGCVYKLLSYKNEDYQKRENSFNKVVELGEEGEWKKLIKKASQDENEQELLIFLLRYEYIDESYVDYISTYEGIRLPEGDQSFYTSIFNREVLEPNYHVEKPDLVLKKINPGYFLRPQLLNFDMTLYVIHKAKGRFEENLYKQLKDDWNIAYICDFLEWTLDKTDYVKKTRIVKSIVANWADAFSNDDEEDLAVLVCYLLRFAKYSVYKPLNQNGQMTAYIKNHEDVFEKVVLKSNREKNCFKDGLQSLSIKIPTLELQNIDHDVIDIILETDSYEANEQNLFSLLEYFSNLPISKPLARFNDLPQGIKNRFIEEMEQVYDCVLEVGEDYSDAEDDIIRFLNDAEISFDTCEKYIEKMRCVIHEGNEIECIDVLGCLAEKGKLRPTLENLQELYEKNRESKKPIAFSNYIKYINSISKKEYGKYTDRNSALFERLSVLPGIESDLYRVIVSKREAEISLDKNILLTDKQVEILIKLGYLNVSDEQTFMFVYQKYQILHGLLIKNEFETFIRFLCAGKVNLEPEELIQILELNISDDEKYRVVTCTNVEIPVKTVYSDAIKMELMKRVKSLKNVNEIMDSYKLLPDSVKNELLETVKRIRTNGHQIGDIPYPIMIELVSKKMIDLTNKELRDCISHYRRAEVKNILKKGNLDKYLELLGKKEIGEEEENDSVIEELKRRKWINDNKV